MDDSEQERRFQQTKKTLERWKAKTQYLRMLTVEVGASLFGPAQALLRALCCVRGEGCLWLRPGGSRRPATKWWQNAADATRAHAGR